MDADIPSVAAPHWLNPQDRRTETAALFERTFQREPEGIWAAPGRINLIGEHVDYHEGRCLPTALPHLTFAAVGLRQDGMLRAVSDLRPQEPFTMALADVAPGAVPGWASYVAGVTWALAREGVAVPGLDVAVTSAVPVGAGLSSSAALECAVAVALAELLGLPLDDAGRAHLAQLCVTAENEIAGALTGGMDQAASMRATVEHALLLDMRTGAAEQLRFRPLAFGMDILVIDTNAHHELNDGQYASRRTQTERAATLLGVRSLRDIDHLDSALADLDETGESDDVLRRRVRHVVTELDRVTQAAQILADGNVAPLGSVLTASHASLRDDYEVSCPELDVAVETAVKAGALGARMVGGGFGGSAIALAPADRLQAVAEAVVETFAAHGFAAPAFLTAPPSAGAHRVA